MAALARKTVVVTGSQGKVGRHVAAAFKRAGWLVVGVDLVRGIYDCPAHGDAFPEVYQQVDLCDAGSVFSVVARFRPAVVVHTAAIPDPTHNAPHEVLQKNTMATFNVVEAAVRFKVARVVYLSSEQVPGYFASERVVPAQGASLGLPHYFPVDEAHPITPSNPYAVSKHFGELLCDAAVRRCAELSCVSIRPSWCQDESNIERNLGPLVRDPALGNEGAWRGVVWRGGVACAHVCV